MILPKNFRNLIIAGDFNLNLDKLDIDIAINDYVDCMHACGLKNFGTSKTFLINSKLISTLDHIFGII